MIMAEDVGVTNMQLRSGTGLPLSTQLLMYDWLTGHSTLLTLPGFLCNTFSAIACCSRSLPPVDTVYIGLSTQEPSNCTEQTRLGAIPVWALCMLVAWALTAYIELRVLRC